MGREGRKLKEGKQEHVAMNADTLNCQWSVFLVLLLLSRKWLASCTL